MSKKKSPFQGILDKLNIDETLTKPIKREKAFTKVKEIVRQKPDYNFCADLLFLPESKKFKYCLTVVDLFTDEFDLEPVKDKEPKTILDAMLKMFKRPYLKKPYASISTDSGNEFKGVFQKWMYENSILHRTALPARHSQVASVESLNRQLGRLFNGYMNAQELKTGKQNKDWISIVPMVREDLNKYRKERNEALMKKGGLPPYVKPELDLTIQSKFKVGDLVYRQLDRPENALGEALAGKFREQDFRFDRQPRKIVKVLSYPGKIPFRYIVKGLEDASFTEAQLQPAKEKEELFEVKQILEKRVVNKKVEYLTWYYGEKKKQSSWQPEAELKKFVPHLITEFNEKSKKKK